MAEDTMLRVAGKPFRCKCGCNVFHTYKVWRKLRRHLRFECNACGRVYAGA